MASKESNKKELMKSTIDLIVSHVNMVDRTGEAGNRYQALLSKMSYEEFNDFMLSLKNGDDILYVNIPNLSKKGVTFENNVKVAEKLGVQFFQRLRITDPNTGKKFITPKRYCVIDLPVRRQIQTIKTGISVADDDNHIDPTTGQVVGVSKSASLSSPEALILYSRGLNKSLEEMLKVRGGDTDAQRYAYTKLQQTGSVSLSEVEQLGTRATSTDTLSTYLKAMHIDNNL